MLGNIFLTLALLASVFSVIMYYFTYRGYENTLKMARLSYHVMAVLVIAASALLLHAILTHQYEYKYVFGYSGSDLSTGLLMSTFWAGQEGSFLLWVLFTAITGLILLEYTAKRGDLEPRVMMIFTLAAGFLLVMVNPLLKSPFTYIYSEANYIDIKYLNRSLLSMPFISGFSFQDPGSGQQFIKMGPDLYAALTAGGIELKEFIIAGKGLNPLLQNFWMQIHPPLLFVGFAMSTVPFAFAVSALMKNEYKDWVKQALPWVLSCAMVLGFAIMLGGYWAYGVLGWGGYWGWDPVENASLVPWLIGVASIHTLLVQKKTQAGGGTGRFVKTNLILSILTFVLVIYSTFLTRSGILGDASVHSFAEPGMLVYLFLVLFIVVFAGLGLSGLIYRWKYLTANFEHEENMLSRELALFTGAVALIASALIVLFGTSAPIFGTTVEIRFYNELNLPIAIIIGIINGLSLFVKWKATEGKEVLKSSIPSLIVTFVVTLMVVFIGGVYDLMMIILTFASLFALFVNIEVAWKIMQGQKIALGSYVAHAGMALFLLGVMATGAYKKEKQVDLPKGETVDVMGYDLTFTGYETIEGGKKYAFNIDVAKDGDVEVVAPVMYIAEFNNSLMREPDILSMFTKDYYISPISYLDGKDQSSSNNVVNLNKGKSYEFNDANITFTAFNFDQHSQSSMMSGGKFEIGAKLTVNFNGKNYEAEPIMTVIGGERSFTHAEVPEANLKIDMTNLDASGRVSLVFSLLDGSETTIDTAKDILTIEASIEPFIILVWAGVLVMVLGFFVSIVRRSKESIVE
ncbi:heme lyase CcmF/NrfE family subunit [Bacteroidota bacterium]